MPSGIYPVDRRQVDRKNRLLPASDAFSCPTTGETEHKVSSDADGSRWFESGDVPESERPRSSNHPLTCRSSSLMAQFLLAALQLELVHGLIQVESSQDMELDQRDDLRSTHAE